MTSRTFGQLIERYRRDVDLTQEELATRAGVHRGIVGRAERADDVTRDAAERLVRALHAEHPLRPRQYRDLAELFLLPKGLPDTSDVPRVICLLVPHAYRNSYWSQVVEAIEQRASIPQCSVMIFQHYEELNRELTTLTFLDEVSNRSGLSGLIVAPALELSGNPALRRDLLESLQQRGIPTVFIDRKAQRAENASSRSHIPYIGPNNVNAAKLAVLELVRNGHTRIAALFDSPHGASNYEERLMGYQEALKESGLKYDAALVRFGKEGRIRDPRGVGTRGPVTSQGVALARELLELPAERRPTAIFCANYRYALDAVEAAKDSGLVIPRDLSIIGFDNVAELDEAEPKIGRIWYSLDELARQAFNTLMQLIEQPNDNIARRDVPINDFVLEVKGSVARPFAEG